MLTNIKVRNRKHPNNQGGYSCVREIELWVGELVFRCEGFTAKSIEQAEVIAEENGLVLIREDLMQCGAVKEGSGPE